MRNVFSRVACGVFTAALVVWARVAGAQCISLTGSPYQQDFNTLASSGTSNVMPAGWYFSESGTNADTNYTAGYGSGNGGDTYSFGAALSSDRALGGLQSGSLIPTIGACFVNNTGLMITTLQIGYTGEEWRLGTAGRTDKLTFQYSADATSLTTGVWTGVTALDFTTPATTTTGAKDGNLAANRTVIAPYSIVGTPVAAGATFWIRWNDVNASGADDGLAVDDFSLTAVNGPVLPLLSIDDVTKVEGNAGTQIFTFTVSLSTPAGVGGVTFNIATADGTATVAGSDYVAQSLTGVTIPEASSSTTFDVIVNGDATIEFTEKFTVNVSSVVGAYVYRGTGTGTIVDDDRLPTLISAVQGTGTASTMVGTTLVIDGIVIGSFQGTDGLGGFFVEEEDLQQDGNAATSEGIYVYSNMGSVAVGDRVRVEGTVTEYSGLTELSPVAAVTVISSGNTLPTAVTTLTVPPASAAAWEPYEGMLVTFPGTLTVSDSSSLAVYGELTLSSGGSLYQPTNFLDPDDQTASNNTYTGFDAVAAAAVNTQQTTNNSNKLILDDGRGPSYLSPIAFISTAPGNTVRIGDTVTGLSGVLTWQFNAWTIEPTTAPVFVSGEARTPTAPGVGSAAVKVGFMNVDNYFVTLGSRGAGTLAEFNMQTSKIAAALKGLGADVIGLAELEKAFPATSGAASSIAAALSAATSETWAAVPDPWGSNEANNPGTDADIKSGMIYKTSTLTLLGSSTTDYPTDLLGAPAGTYSRAPFAQAFTTSGGGKFAVVVNHLRSKSCLGAPALPDLDADQSDGQGCYNDRRRNQVESTLNFLTNKLAATTTAVIVVGDHNAYAQEDPIDRYRAAGFVDVIAANTAGQPTSYGYSGQIGQLDHAFTTPGLAPYITGAAVWHVNANEPAFFDYTAGGKPSGFSASPDAYRSSDHDPIVVGIDNALPVPVELTNFSAE